MSKLKVKIGWLYPDLMSTYGDRGNIMILKKRCELRGIEVDVEKITLDTKVSTLNSCDLIFMGGAQDTQQEIVVKDLKKEKGRLLSKLVDKGTPGLYICGAYQFLGKYYITADGTKLPGLGIFPLHTENKGKGKRLIGNVIATHNTINSDSQIQIIGFENHGGRTYLDDKGMAFGVIDKGYGNNGEDGTEGIVYKNSIGTYLHGPLLPKNPEISDWLIAKALEHKYEKNMILKPLDNSLEEKARNQTIHLHFS